MNSIKIIILGFSIFYSGCYGFKGISIPPDISTFQVEDFENSAPNAPAAIDQTFSEALKSKIRNESRLRLESNNPDIIFKGTVNRFQITSESPQEGNTVAFNKLTIGVQVEYTSTKNEEDNWKQSFSFYIDFDSNADFQSQQDAFIEEIFKQITEDVFNKSFTNW